MKPTLFLLAAVFSNSKNSFGDNLITFAFSGFVLVVLPCGILKLVSILIVNRMFK